MNINEIILKTHPLSYKRAEETAIRTGTALVVMRKGKLVKVKPPYKYVRVSTIKKSKRVARVLLSMT
jgi:hypothetical protein